MLSNKQKIIPNIHLQSASYLNLFATYWSLKNHPLWFFANILGHNLLKLNLENFYLEQFKDSSNLKTLKTQFISYQTEKIQLLP